MGTLESFTEEELKYINEPFTEDERNYINLEIKNN